MRNHLREKYWHYFLPVFLNKPISQQWAQVVRNTPNDAEGTSETESRTKGSTHVKHMFFYLSYFSCPNTNILEELLGVVPCTPEMTVEMVAVDELLMIKSMKNMISRRERHYFEPDFSFISLCICKYICM